MNSLICFRFLVFLVKSFQFLDTKNCQNFGFFPIDDWFSGLTSWAINRKEEKKKMMKKLDFGVSIPPG